MVACLIHHYLQEVSPVHCIMFVDIICSLLTTFQVHCKLPYLYYLRLYNHLKQTLQKVELKIDELCLIELKKLEFGHRRSSENPLKFPGKVPDSKITWLDHTLSIQKIMPRDLFLLRKLCYSDVEACLKTGYYTLIPSLTLNL